MYVFVIWPIGLGVKVRARNAVGNQFPPKINKFIGQKIWQASCKRSVIYQNDFYKLQPRQNNNWYHVSHEIRSIQEYQSTLGRVHVTGF